MGTQTVESLVPGGKATAAPPLGPALGPLGVNIGQVVQEINKKTAAFDGMQVPVKVEVDDDTKEFSISIGTPPAAGLVLKEAGVKKGSGTPNTDKVADILIQQVIKVAKMKEDALLGKDTKQKVREIIGTCQSMGILVEGMDAQDALKAVNEGKFDKAISEEQTEISEEQKKALEEEKKKLAAEMEKKRAEYEQVGKEIVNKFAAKEPATIKAKLKEAGIPEAMIKELMPEEEKKAEDKPAAAAEPAKK